MKGILHKTKQGWVVRYRETTPLSITTETLPLHRDNISDILSNPDSKIENLVSKEVEFEIVKETYDDGSECKYAKLINHENSAKQDVLNIGKDTADYIDRHIIESMKELAKEGFKPKLSEMSDEEIEKGADECYPFDESDDGLKGMIISAKKGAWFDAIKWYREQLKQHK
jgi:hypothetical protein